MTRRPRLRKTARWAGTLLCAATAGGAIASLWWSAQWDGGAHTQVLACGAYICVSHYQPEPRHVIEVFPRGEGFDLYLDGPSGLRFSRIPPQHLRWWPTLSVHQIGQTNRRAWYFFLPIYLPFLALAVPTALLWRIDLVAAKRLRAGRCVQC